MKEFNYLNTGTLRHFRKQKVWVRDSIQSVAFLFIRAFYCTLYKPLSAFLLRCFSAPQLLLLCSQERSWKERRERNKGFLRQVKESMLIKILKGNRVSSCVWKSPRDTCKYLPDLPALLRFCRTSNMANWILWEIS